eukprot:CAMPEP_0197863062 /NCGR_PEP_ID=MMETSP1438-20131217/40250_1 /TAXON_ID=1461541 /ORGANISM="Pterosperma sp., Strain CCMP1384" /LENGTH=162 /DNA_ID=CAMNT_0043480811 /DNA_START=164 /DNA_END=653 /DNA_ORIENTATION=+
MDDCDTNTSCAVEEYDDDEGDPHPGEDACHDKCPEFSRCVESRHPSKPSYCECDLNHEWFEGSCVSVGLTGVDAKDGAEVSPLFSHLLKQQQQSQSNNGKALAQDAYSVSEVQPRSRGVTNVALYGLVLTTACQVGVVAWLCLRKSVGTEEKTEDESIAKEV